MSEEMEKSLEQVAEDSVEVVSDEVLSDAEVSEDQVTEAESATENENAHWRWCFAIESFSCAR